MIDFFNASENLSRKYMVSCNGTGLQWLSNWLLKALMDKSEAQHSLNEIVHESLVSIIYPIFQIEKSSSITTSLDDLIVQNKFLSQGQLKYINSNVEIAKLLNEEVKNFLYAGHTLRVDGAAIEKVQDSFKVTIL